jgi:hypothetical protein
VSNRAVTKAFLSMGKIGWVPVITDYVKKETVLTLHASAALPTETAQFIPG